jgi:alkylation response protein AidB-like acyl-CoA dehydrogenase
VESLLDKEELRDAARRMLAEQIDRQAWLRSDADVVPAPAGLWPLMAELGWLALAVPEAQGGLGQPPSVLSVLHHELGRALSPAPFASAMLAAEALALAGHGLVEAAVGGEATVVPLFDEDATLARRADGDAVVLDGTLGDVIDAPLASHLLLALPASAQGEALLALLPLPRAGVTVQHVPTWDRTRQMGDVQLKALRLDAADIVLRGEAAQKLIARMHTQRDLALAADALGGVEIALEETLAYMAQRQQFGRPIASFQALKHRCADHHAALEGAQALLRAACRAADQQAEDAAVRAASARLHAGAVYLALSEDSVQLHGGIGFTWEQACHLYLKRARLSEVLGGRAARRADRIAPSLFLHAA